MSGPPYWKWYTGLLTGKTCAGCSKPFWERRDGGVIEYDGKLWHLDCALDKLLINPYAGHPP
jgi:hypothetical protein